MVQLFYTTNAKVGTVGINADRFAILPKPIGAILPSNKTSYWDKSWFCFFAPFVLKVPTCFLYDGIGVAPLRSYARA